MRALPSHHCALYEEEGAAILLLSLLNFDLGGGGHFVSLPHKWKPVSPIKSSFYCCFPRLKYLLAASSAAALSVSSQTGCAWCGG